MTVERLAGVAESEEQSGLPGEAERAEAARTGTALALWARALGDAPALISPAGDRSFVELEVAVNRLARALRQRGLQTGDALAIVVSNRPEFVETVLACLRTGLRFTPVNWHLTADEMAYIIDDCHAKALVGDARFADTLTEAVRRCPKLEVCLTVGGPIEGFESYDRAVGQQDGATLEAPVLGTRMLYTSGTTGRPKGVVRPPNYSTHLTAITDAPRYRAGSGQMNLCTGPFYHGGPLSFSLQAPLARGVGVVIMEKWDAESALALIERHRITHTHMVPTMFHRLLRLPEEVRRRYDVSSLQYVLHGAAPCTVETKTAMIDWFGPVLWEYFAATEGAGASCSPEQWRAHPGTVGLPPRPGHILILDDAGRACPPRTAGTIYIHRDETDFEYWNDPEKTEAARRDAYFTVGDVGYLDEDGYLFVTDRGVNLIVSGGVNIYPAEIEATLLQHPGVRDVAVIGVPNAEWGEEVKAVVECEALPSDPESLAAELIAWSRARIAHFKCPRSVDFVERLPRLDNGKLYRGALRSRYRCEPATTQTRGA